MCFLPFPCRSKWLFPRDDFGLRRGDVQSQVFVLEIATFFMFWSCYREKCLCIVRSAF